MSVYCFNACIQGDVQVETREGKKPIRDVIAGEDVLSPIGFVRVKNKFDQGKKKVVRVKTATGREIICTLDHKFQTDEGMMRLEEVLRMKKKILTRS
jgi:intein/homing endonuclease